LTKGSRAGSLSVLLIILHAQFLKGKISELSLELVCSINGLCKTEANSENKAYKILTSNELPRYCGMQVIL
jgi:hypothetical protein